MRKRIKRGGAVLLALALALTPVTLQAEEGVTGQTEKSLAGTNEGQTSVDVRPADSKETSQTESGNTGAERSENTVQTEGENGQYDITKPIINKVEFPQNGKTLTSEDTLELLVYAQDMESGINRVRAEVYFEDGNGVLHYYTMESSYD